MKITVWSVVLVILGSVVLAEEPKAVLCETFDDACFERLESERLETAGWVGLSLEKGLDRSGLGLVSDVVPESPAEAAGIEIGDLLVGLDDTRLSREEGAEEESVERFWRKHLHLKKGDTVRYQLVRDGEEIEVAVVAANRPLEAVRFFLQVELSIDASGEAVQGYRAFVARRTKGGSGV